MKSENQQTAYQISISEMAVSLIAMIVGTGVIVLPRALAVEMNTTDGWITVIVSGGFVMFFVFIITKLQKEFPGRNFLQFLAEGLFGKWISKLLAFSFFVYFICVVSFLSRFLAITIDIYLLPQTPTEVIVMILLLLSTYAISKGVQGIIHLNIMFTPIVLSIAFVIIIFEIPEFDLLNLRPIMADGFIPLFKGLKETMFSFLGVEILFFFMAYMKKNDIRCLPLLTSIGIISFLYFSIIIATFAIFGLNSTKVITFPMIDLVKEIDIPGGIFERVEPIFITIWFMSMFNTIAAAHFLADTLLKKELLPYIKGGLLTPIAVFIIFINTFLTKSYTELSLFGEWLSNLGLINIIVCILVVSVTLWYRTKRSKPSIQEEQA